MKKICWSCLKFALLFVVIISSALALYTQYTGRAFDPVREIRKLQSENRRDDALDLARFYRENHLEDQKKFIDLEKQLQYTTTEKIKSFLKKVQSS